MLPKSILYALGEGSRASGIRFFAGDDYEKNSLLMQKISKLLMSEYLKLEKLLNEEPGGCKENRDGLVPFDMFQRLTDYGVLCPLESLALHRRNGTVIPDCNGSEAIRAALKAFAKKYPNITYDGYAGYYWSDKNGDGFEQMTFYSSDEMNDPDKAYDFMGDYLRLWCMKNTVFWGRLKEGIEKYGDHEEVVRTFERYAEWIGDYIEQAKNLV